MRRREFLDWLAVSAAITSAAAASGCDLAGEPMEMEKETDAEPPVSSQRTLQIGMLVYPKFTALDLIGPQTIFAQLSNTKATWSGRTSTR